MIDQSFSTSNLGQLIVRHDLRAVPVANWFAFRQESVGAAVKSASTAFGGKNPLERIAQKKKFIYRATAFSDELVIRKLGRNLRKVTKATSGQRGRLVLNLRHFLEEGVPYRVYRLDVKNFYESFANDAVDLHVHNLSRLSPQSRALTIALLEHFRNLGGTGVPRGMAIGAVLSDSLMQAFDAQVRQSPGVYFYGRFVDDIALVTSGAEDESSFLAYLSALLPSGLQFNKDKRKFQIQTILEKCKQHSSKNTGPPKKRVEISYLGYSFTVQDPTSAPKDSKSPFRFVQTELSPSKVKKIKTRIVRAFVDFSKTADANLLIDRIKFLTCNFSIIEGDTSKRKLAGIFYNYPCLSSRSRSLLLLDQFLRNAVLSGKGRLYSQWPKLAKPALTRKILSHSFKAGFERRIFVHFSAKRIGEIQACWKYE